MSASYDCWMTEAEESIQKFTKIGIIIHKVHVDIDEFIIWSQNKNLPIDGHARTEFANEQMAKDHHRRKILSDAPLPTKEELKAFKEKAKGLDLSEIWEPYLRRPKAAVCPIFREDDSGPQHFGCGVLIKVAESHFLLTAAHVADERHTSTLLIPSTSGFVNLYGEFVENRLPPSKCRTDDPTDVCVVGLPEDLVIRLHDELVFLNREDCDLFDETRSGDAYTMIGYPARKSSVRGDTAFTEQFSLSGSGVVDFSFDKFGLDPQKHLAIQHRTKKAVQFSTMLKVQSPHPEGMSGGGIFAWSKDLPKPSALAQPKLVGILTEYHQSRNVFIGTRLSSHLMAIRWSDPKLPIYPRKTDKG